MQKKSGIMKSGLDTMPFFLQEDLLKVRVWRKKTGQSHSQKGKGDLCFGRCWRRPPGLIRATPKNPDRNRNCPRPPVSWPGCRFRATSAKRLRRTWRRSFVQYSHGSDLITRAGAWPKMRCCHLRWSTTSFRPGQDQDQVCEISAC